MTSKSFYNELEIIANDRCLDIQDVLNAVETALIKACGSMGYTGDIKVEFTPEAFKLRIFEFKYVVDEIDPEGPDGQILLEEAREIKPKIKCRQMCKIQITKMSKKEEYKDILGILSQVSEHVEGFRFKRAYNLCIKNNIDKLAETLGKFIENN